MKLLRRFLRWLFPDPFARLLTKARGHGMVTLAEIGLGHDVAGWYVSIRPPGERGLHAHRYSWTGQDENILQALAKAVQEAEDAPKMRQISGGTYAPKLGGKEFDDE